ncbi:MAG: DUF3450 family protein [Pseudomonadota bacterium]
MKALAILFSLACLFLSSPGKGLCLEDMRESSIQARNNQAMLLEKARQEKHGAELTAQKSRAAILDDKTKLTEAIEKLKQSNAALETGNQKLEAGIASLTGEEKALRARFSDMDAVVKELTGYVRINARDLKSMLRQNLQAALMPSNESLLTSLADNSRFPGMEDIRAMADLLMDEIRRSGQVRVQTGTIVDTQGREVEARILVVGNFTAAYQKDDTVGFLLYSEKSAQLFALSKPPGMRMQKKIRQYIAGLSEDLPIDMSKGGAMRQLTHKLSLWEQIPKGGPIVWPIVIIAALAILIILERTVALYRRSMNPQPFMDELKHLMETDNWDGCVTLCRRYPKKTLARALAAGIEFRTMKREDMENALQEAILREIPSLERYLSTLGMLAAIAPLLGLLGTVTGMINTFHVITFYGTSDPRMMSGGISEALVTTMLGLTVAIPIMLCHTLLNRKVETLISTMEEKAVAFVNAVSVFRKNT